MAKWMQKTARRLISLNKGSHMNQLAYSPSSYTDNYTGPDSTPNGARYRMLVSCDPQG